MNAFDSIRNFLSGLRNAAPAHPRDAALLNWLGLDAYTASGAMVTPDAALRVSAVYACVNRIANTVGQTSLILYRDLPGGQGKDKDGRNPLYKVLHRRPNRWQTPFEFKHLMTAHVALRGNAYAAIVSSPLSAVSELIPLHPDRVTPFWAPDGRRAYQYRPLQGPEQIFLQNEVLHISGLSFDGLKGVNPIEYCRESIGLAIKTEEHGARLFSNGAQVGMALTHPGKLSQEAADNLKRKFDERHSGTGNAHKTLVLEEGMTVSKLGLTASDSQFLESRKFQVVDIARIFEMPLHMIGDLERSTNNNIEQQSLEFVKFTMGPWFKRFEEAINRDLVYQPDRYVEFLLEGLLRGDIKSRYGAYAVGRQWGWLSVNDIRQKENMNPVEGGDIYITPLNMAPIDGSTPSQDEPNPPEDNVNE